MNNNEILELNITAFSTDAADAKSQCALGLKYIRERNYEKAFKCYSKSAQQGDAEAQYMFAGMYEDGRAGKEDHSEAFKWYRKAAEQGHDYAQLCLADAYYDGYGVEKNEAEAVKWYRKSAMQGNNYAQYELEKLGERW